MRDYSDTENAPAKIKAADGKTILHRFEVEGVIYARSLDEAQKRLSGADTVLDHARIVPRVVQAELERE